MAQLTVISITDDIDGSEATQTVESSYRGRSYSIDLDDSNASEFDDALAPCTGAAEQAGQRSGGPRLLRLRTVAT